MMVTEMVAHTIAHEMGHNFGMKHDDNCDCPDENCIMNEYTSGKLAKHWSSCSIEELNYSLSRGMNHCLRNKPTKLVDSSRCGNGFVESEEQCDCGLPEFCKNECCNPYTCMFYEDATCATGECCDVNTCKPKAAGTECRAAGTECDLPEFCTGESEFCPADFFKRDTEPCDNGEAFCYKGDCRSHDTQCKTLWGPSGGSLKPCYYEMNNNDTIYGNCGFDRLTNKFIKCDISDVMCGVLQCNSSNGVLELGNNDRDTAITRYSWMYNGTSPDILQCRTARIDLGLESLDPGLTPNGAKCGEQKMCLNQQCMDLEELNKQGIGLLCKEACSGNGVCNNRGHCHCNDGFGGEVCNEEGYGGSVDSGPASYPSREYFILNYEFVIINKNISHSRIIVLLRVHPPLDSCDNYSLGGPAILLLQADN